MFSFRHCERKTTRTRKKPFHSITIEEIAREGERTRVGISFLWKNKERTTSTRQYLPKETSPQWEKVLLQPVAWESISTNDNVVTSDSGCSGSSKVAPFRCQALRQAWSTIRNSRRVHLCSPDIGIRQFCVLILSSFEYACPLVLDN